MKATKIMLFITALAMIAGLLSCTSVRKVSNNSVTKTDSTAHTESNTSKITQEDWIAQDTVHTDSSTLETSFDFWNTDTTEQTAETEDIYVKVKPSKGKINLKVTAKPKAVPVNINKSKTTVEQGTTKSDVSLNKKEKQNNSEKKKESLPWWFWLVLGLMVLWLLWKLIKWLKSKYTFNIF